MESTLRGGRLRALKHEERVSPQGARAGARSCSSRTDEDEARRLRGSPRLRSGRPASSSRRALRSTHAKTTSSSGGREPNAVVDRRRVFSGVRAARVVAGFSTRARAFTRRQRLTTRFALRPNERANTQEAFRRKGKRTWCSSTARRREVLRFCVVASGRRVAFGGRVCTRQARQGHRRVPASAGRDETSAGEHPGVEGDGETRAVRFRSGARVCLGRRRVLGVRRSRLGRGRQALEPMPRARTRTPRPLRDWLVKNTPRSALPRLDGLRRGGGTARPSCCSRLARVRPAGVDEFAIVARWATRGSGFDVRGESDADHACVMQRAWAARRRAMKSTPSASSASSSGVNAKAARAAVCARDNDPEPRPREAPRARAARAWATRHALHGGRAAPGPAERWTGARALEHAVLRRGWTSWDTDAVLEKQPGAATRLDAGSRRVAERANRTAAGGSELGPPRPPRRGRRAAHGTCDDPRRSPRRGERARRRGARAAGGRRRRRRRRRRRHNRRAARRRARGLDAEREAREAEARRARVAAREGCARRAGGAREAPPGTRGRDFRRFFFSRFSRELELLARAEGGTRPRTHVRGGESSSARRGRACSRRGGDSSRVKPRVLASGRRVGFRVAGRLESGNCNTRCRRRDTGRASPASAGSESGFGVARKPRRRPASPRNASERLRTRTRGRSLPPLGGADAFDEPAEPENPQVAYAARGRRVGQRRVFAASCTTRWTRDPRSPARPPLRPRRGAARDGPRRRALVVSIASRRDDTRRRVAAARRRPVKRSPSPGGFAVERRARRCRRRSAAAASRARGHLSMAHRPRLPCRASPRTKGLRFRSPSFGRSS